MDEPIEKAENITAKDKIIKVIILIVIIIFIIPIAIFMLILEIIYRITFKIRIIQNRKRIIFVTSNSPIWHDYLRYKWFPRISEFAYVLNWSERKQWNESQWEVKMFHHWGGRRDMVPLIIVYINILNIKVFRLYEPFIDYKHGKERKLTTIQNDIEKAINSFIPK